MLHMQWETENMWEVKIATIRPEIILSNDES